MQIFFFFWTEEPQIIWELASTNPFILQMEKLRSNFSDSFILFGFTSTKDNANLLDMHRMGIFIQ